MRQKPAPAAKAALPPTPPSPPGRLQMADIARLAGVSVSTVSRALAGSALVNAETRGRIAELARSLNYTINVGAQNLRLKQNRTVAVVVPHDAQTRQPLSDPFFLGLIGALADALTERGHDMLLTRVDAQRLDQAALPYQTGRAAGVVLVGQWHHHDQLNAMAVQRLPFVVWGAQMPGQLYTTVGSDNVLGGDLATTHLLQQGARQVAFLGDPALPEVGQRHQGWLQAHARMGLVADPGLAVVAPFEQAGIERAVAQLHQRHPQLPALFAASDLMAMTAITTLRRLGRRVPEDLRVCGYDDIALAQHYHPSLSTVRQPLAQAGVALVQALLAQLAGAPVAPVVLPTELVVRGSSRG